MALQLPFQLNVPNYGSIGGSAMPGAAGLASMSPMGSIPSLTGGAGGAAGPSTASNYSPISFTDGSFIVSSSPDVGTSVAGAVSGVTNSFAGLGSLQNMMPYLAIAAVVYLIATRKKHS